MIHHDCAIYCYLTNGWEVRMIGSTANGMKTYCTIATCSTEEEAIGIAELFRDALRLLPPSAPPKPTYSLHEIVAQGRHKDPERVFHRKGTPS